VCFNGSKTLGCFCKGTHKFAYLINDLEILQNLKYFFSFNIIMFLCLKFLKISRFKLDPQILQCDLRLLDLMVDNKGCVA